MNVDNRIADVKLTLQHCLQKIKSYDLDGGLVYGKFAGAYEDNGYLSVSNETLTALIKLDLASERVG